MGSGLPAQLLAEAAPARLMPQAREGVRAEAVLRVLRHVAILKSCRLSLRSKGFCLVSRGTRVKLGRGAAIHVPRGSFLFVGFAHANPTPCAVHLGRGARLSVRGTVQIHRGCRVLVNDGARLEIGPGSYLNDGSTVTCFQHISIGSGCSISWNTDLCDTNVHELVVAGRPRPRTRPVVIGDRVWIGCGATVLSGVSIGDGAVVGAASVVTADVPAGVVVAGTPARVIHEGVSWNQ